MCFFGSRILKYSDALERHQKSRIFQGRFTELLCAASLEAQGWTIVGLEALREGADIEATDSEVTTASVDNMKLLHADKVALAFTLPDSAFEAHQGKLKGLNEKVAVRSLAALYSNYLHIVALDGVGIKSINDLKGKRVSTGAPGSGTEIRGLRVLEAYGISPKDLKSQERLGVAESAGAMKDRRIDAFIWDGGLPTAAVLDLGATPGIKIQLIPHGDSVAKMTAKYGPLYFVAKAIKQLSSA